MSSPDGRPDDIDSGEDAPESERPVQDVDVEQAHGAEVASSSYTGEEIPGDAQIADAPAEDPPAEDVEVCLLYTSPSPRDKRQSRMPSSA